MRESTTYTIDEIREEAIMLREVTDYALEMIDAIAAQNSDAQVTVWKDPDPGKWPPCEKPPCKITEEALKTVGYRAGGQGRNVENLFLALAAAASDLGILQAEYTAPQSTGDPIKFSKITLKAEGKG